MKKIDWRVLIFSIALCEGAGVIGSIFTFQAIPTWYATLMKPSFTPPGWIFGPVWTTLYALMGISLYRIWKKGMKKKQVRYAITFFGIQLALNALWSIIFFGVHNLFGALVEIVVLLSFIVATIVQFKKLDKLAAYFLIPYLLWTSFATLLTYSIWELNR